MDLEKHHEPSDAASPEDPVKPDTEHEPSDTPTPGTSREPSHAADRRSAVGGPRSVTGRRSKDPDAVVYSALLDAAAEGRTVVLATVVDARGSTPRDVGTKMLIEPGGGLVGTIGGGCGEGDVIAAAAAVAETGTPRLVRVQLTDDMDSWSPAICGGIMDVLLEPVVGERPA